MIKLKEYRRYIINPRALGVKFFDFLSGSFILFNPLNKIVERIGGIK